MENRENKGFKGSGKGANPSTPRYSTSAAGRNAARLTALLSKRYYELVVEWLKAGHADLPSDVELLFFLEGEL